MKKKKKKKQHKNINAEFDHRSLVYGTLGIHKRDTRVLAIEALL